MMPDAPARSRARRLKFIGCEIIYREACFLAATGPHFVDLQFMMKGLHDLSREDMLQKLQAAVDAVSPESNYEAILLGYARCNDGLVGLRARDIPLVVPRAHDCITFFFGSRAAYQDYFDRYPGTYYLTTGWTERNTAEGGNYSKPAYGVDGVMAKLGLTESYEVMVAKYGKENADFIVESVGGWLKNYSRSLYLEMGICDEQPFIERAREDAQQRSWEFEVRKGDWSLLRKLFLGQWDEDFVVVRPGESIIAQSGTEVLAAGA